LTRTVHERGAKIAVQLFHGGRESAKFLSGIGKVAKGPSFVKDDLYFMGEYSALTEDDIWELIGAFGDAAVRARESGFDAVQLHGAHAYLLSQFLSPFSNRRIDDWGGSLEKRLRFHREVYNNIRKKVGADYPVLIKTGGQDGFPGGLELDEGKKAAGLLAQWGYDALEISQGLRGKLFEGTEFRIQIDSIDREGYFGDWCREIKRQVAVPVMAVGGFRTFTLMEKIVQDGEADFISLCRPFIRQPGLVNEWQKGNRDRATCISCNECLAALKRGENVRCVYEEREITHQDGGVDVLRPSSPAALSAARGRALARYSREIIPI
jgi:2,4-dienoyl-CoA reductase-like NADH-dependent reductase (Old Yellow Enzyme family)